MKKVAIITGASRGIGAATAKLLAENGYAVCVNYNQDADNAEKLKKDILATGGEAIAVQANVGKEEDILRLFKTVDEALGPVTLLVNNAGTNGGNTQVENITLNQLQDVFSTNVYGTFIASREAVKRMKQNGGGSIINISSEAAKFGGNNLAHYAASKAAINTFTIGFAREVAAYRIRVNTISPGVINTEIHANATPERINTLMKSIPMGRMGDTMEIAQAIKWLASDHASYISGAIIPITGSR
ncbi:MAG TPA: SDR family oxidoreductase [Gammaproteobacteria bacterium]|nr:SDR family oxidoreductase [Gammaproteobacteria bacterium]